MYDIAAQMAADLGGADTHLSLVRRFASLAVLAEEQECEAARTARRGTRARRPSLGRGSADRTGCRLLLAGVVERVGGRVVP
jgi:hypothetical protein